MNAFKKKNISIFVDVQNIYYTTRDAFGRRFDYNAFWAELAQDFNITNAFAYAVDRGDEKQKQFQNILRAIGFTVKLKPFIQRSDGSAKGDWDVGITLDVVKHALSSDLVVLVTGDGDFDLLVNKVKNDDQTPVIVYGVEQLTSRSLIQAASEFRPVTGALLLK
ncbi:MAG: nuclease [Gammaproteobacteria bacterium]|nr:MAG: nuclease [Gammaproteobacteria bacterium]